SPTPAPVSANSKINDLPLHTTTRNARTTGVKAPSTPTITQRLAVKPQITIGQTTSALTRMTTVNDQTTLS
ncbi:hypothetical protein M9458_009616, partial [Cirrhinus mrigala]